MQDVLSGHDKTKFSVERIPENSQGNLVLEDSGKLEETEANFN